LEAFFPTLFHLDGALLDRFQNEFEKAVALRKIGSKSLSRSPELLHLSLFRLSLRLSAG
jgi:hypothetical protein